MTEEIIEITKVGDNKAKTSEKQADKLRLFFRKFRNNAVRHFQEGVTFRELRTERLYYKVLNNQIKELQKRLNTFKDKYEKEENKTNLLDEHKKLDEKLESLYKRLSKEINDLPENERQELKNKWEQVDAQFDEFENYYTKSNEISSLGVKKTNDKVLKAKADDELEEAAFKYVEDKERENKKITNIEPINIDYTALINTEENEIKPQTYGKGELSNYVSVKENKDNDKAILTIPKKNTVEVKYEKSENVSKDIQQEKKEKMNLTDLTVFETYEDYKKAYFWNKFIKDNDINELEKISTYLSKYAEPSNKDFKNLLSEVKFVENKGNQIKEKEIAEIDNNHIIEIENINKEKENAIKATEDKYIADIQKRDTKIDDQKAKIRKLNSIIKAKDNALEAIKDLSKAAGGMNGIDGAIKASEEKCEAINNRYEKNNQEKEKNAELKDAALAFAQSIELENHSEELKKNEIEKSNEEKTNVIKEETKYVETSDKINLEKQEETPSIFESTVNTQSTLPTFIQEPVVEDNNELVNELSTIDNYLDKTSSDIDTINNMNLNDEQKKILRNQIYSQFDNFVESNSENEKSSSKVR